MGLATGKETLFVIMQNAAVATGNGTAIDVVTGTDGGFETLDLQVQGITTATITFEATIDGTNWVPVAAMTRADNSTMATTATADGIYQVSVGGLRQVRARISAWTTGTITVTASAT